MTTTDVDAEHPQPRSRRTPVPRPVPRGRLALLLGGGVAMLLGLDAGLLLLGLPAPVTIERLPEVHGQLMLIGFLGTVIALERAVALRRPWGFSAPLATGFGSLLLLTALPIEVGQVVQLIGLSVLVGIYGALWRRAASTAVAIQWVEVTTPKVPVISGRVVNWVMTTPCNVSVRAGPAHRAARRRSG